MSTQNFFIRFHFFDFFFFATGDSRFSGWCDSVVCWESAWSLWTHCLPCCWPNASHHVPSRGGPQVALLLAHRLSPRCHPVQPTKRAACFTSCISYVEAGPNWFRDFFPRSSIFFREDNGQLGNIDARCVFHRRRNGCLWIWTRSSNLHGHDGWWSSPSRANWFFSVFHLLFLCLTPSSGSDLSRFGTVGTVRCIVFLFALFFVS